MVLQFLGTPSNIDKYTSKCVPANFDAFIRHVPKTSKIEANSLYYWYVITGLLKTAEFDGTLFTLLISYAFII